MHYCIADIHGCREELEALLKKINFSDEDTLYVLGDCIDRGPDPVGVLRVLSMYPNVVPLMGNHEWIMLKILPDLLEAMTEETLAKIQQKDLITAFRYWQRDGGGQTLEAFLNLDADDKDFYLDFVGDFSLYEEVVIGERKYRMIHSLPEDFDEKRFGEERVTDYLFGRPDFTKEWNTEWTYVIGHTPTAVLEKTAGAIPGRIFRKGNVVDIDCCMFADYSLAAFCLETEEAIYIEGESLDR